MTVMKSLLLGSAATLVVVAGAQAADLPTKKGAPAAEYVKVCKVGDIAGFIIPGSDTCLKISGYVNAQIAMGNVKNEFPWRRCRPFCRRCLDLLAAHQHGDERDEHRRSSQRHRLLYPRSGQLRRGDQHRHGPLARSHRAAGRLRRRQVQLDTGSGVVLNAGYVQWAGVTAGKHGSFYDYLAGGDTWKDFFSPDHSGTPINLLAYTATFGGGFSATVSLEQNESVSGFAGAADNIGFPFGSSNFFILGTGNVTISGKALGVRAPDIVASLDVTQSWGGAHLAGVAHNDRYSIAGTINETLFPIAIASDRAPTHGASASSAA